MMTESFHIFLLYHCYSLWAFLNLNLKPELGAFQNNPYGTLRGERMDDSTEFYLLSSLTLTSLRSCVLCDAVLEEQLLSGTKCAFFLKHRLVLHMKRMKRPQRFRSSTRLYNKLLYSTVLYRGLLSLLCCLCILRSSLSCTMLDDQAGEDHQSIFLNSPAKMSEPSAWPLERMQSVAPSKLSSEGALVTPIHVVRTYTRHMIAIPILRLRLPKSSPYHHGAPVKRDFVRRLSCQIIFGL